MTMSIKATSLFLLLSVGLLAQPFTSNSNGSDGALNITQSGDFDPVSLNIDQDGDNIFHFTTINIAQGVTVRLRASKMRRIGPVYWLATGNVTIAGTLDLSGAPGVSSTSAADRALAEPGPGGYSGGAATKSGGQNQRAFGPGSLGSSCNPGHAVALCGPAYGNVFLLPLVGGSGGTGGAVGSGGAGGGAIRISSNGSITLTGSVNADGGSAFNGCQFDVYGGSGGAVHLQASLITITGSITARGGASFSQCGSGSASPGRIRIDATSHTLNTVNPVPLIGPLITAPLPTVFPLVRIVSVAGQTVSANPAGQVLLPDATVNTTNPVSIGIAASGIPPGTVVQLYILTDTAGSDQFVSATPLTGTLQSSTATASVTFPTGVQRLTIRAVW
jgi:hypothetical protein